jgi:Family of unknown function (DUF6186)
VTTRAVTLVGFGAIVGAAVVWTWIAARDRRWASLPEAWDALCRRRLVRIALVVAWIWLGWHLFARGSGAFE